MYKIRDGGELPKKFKIRVTAEQSEGLQKYLFSKGMSWMSGQTEVCFTDVPFLYVTDNRLAYGRTSSFFKSANIPEIGFSDYFEQDCRKIASVFSTKIRRFSKIPHTGASLMLVLTMMCVVWILLLLMIYAIIQITSLM